MLILFNNSFPRLIRTSERRNDLLCRRNDLLSCRNELLSRPNDLLSRRNDLLTRRNDLLSRRLINSSERLIKSSERLINSWERLILCRRNDLLTRRNDLFCCNATRELNAPVPIKLVMTPVHLVISTAESLGHTGCDAQATAPGPHRDWGWMQPHPHQ